MPWRGGAQIHDQIHCAQACWDFEGSRTPWASSHGWGLVLKSDPAYRAESKNTSVYPIGGRFGYPGAVVLKPMTKFIVPKPVGISKDPERHGHRAMAEG